MIDPYKGVDDVPINAMFQNWFEVRSSIALARKTLWNHPRLTPL